MRTVIPGGTIFTYADFNAAPTLPGVKVDDDTGANVVAHSTTAIVNQGGNSRSKVITIPLSAVVGRRLVPKWDDNGGTQFSDISEEIIVSASVTGVVVAPISAQPVPNAEIWVKRYDTRESIIFTMTRPDGSIIDLTDATGVTFKMRNAPDTGTLKITSPGFFVGARTSGQVGYQWAGTDTDGLGGTSFVQNGVPGTSYDAEFQATFSDGRTITSPEASYLTVRVWKDLD